MTLAKQKPARDTSRQKTAQKSANKIEGVISISIH